MIGLLTRSHPSHSINCLLSTPYPSHNSTYPSINQMIIFVVHYYWYLSFSCSVTDSSLFLCSIIFPTVSFIPIFPIVSWIPIFPTLSFIPIFSMVSLIPNRSYGVIDTIISHVSWIPHLSHSVSLIPFVPYSIMDTPSFPCSIIYTIFPMQYHWYSIFPMQYHWYPIFPVQYHWYPIFPMQYHWYPIFPMQYHWYFLLSSNNPFNLVPICPTLLLYTCSFPVIGPFRTRSPSFPQYHCIPLFIQWLAL